MDAKENLQTLSQLRKYQILKKITQLLLSVSVFSLLLSNSSTLSFLCSFNFYVHTFPVQLFKHAIDKNCIFLLCNGLLVFLAKYSGSVSSSSEYNNTSVESFNNYEDVSQSIGLDFQMPRYVEMEVAVDSLYEVQENALEEEGGGKECVIGQVEKSTTNEFIVEEKKEGESGFSINDLEVKESEVFYQGDVKEMGNEFRIEDEEGQEIDVEEFAEEEEEAAVNGVLSLTTDELNKKFDEFIRKMKAEIRFEAQQQLVLVK